MRAPYSNKTRRRSGKQLVAAVLIIAMIAPTITSSEPPSSVDRDEEAALHAEAQRRQLVVLPAPQIIMLTALHPVGGQLADSVYNDGVRMQIEFDSATDMGGFTFALMQKEGVDSLFRFNEPLGSDYVGLWKTSRQFIITILDWPGAGPPQVGEPFGMRASTRTDMARSIRVAAPALSIASQSTSPKMLGSFGPPVVQFVSFTAVPNNQALGDSIYGNGVALLATFNRNTNLGGYEPFGTKLTVSQMSSFMEFSHELGAHVTGTFTDRKTLRLDIVDSTGGRADIGVFYLKIKATEAYGLRNFPAACAPTQGMSPLLSGDFGPSNVRIVSVEAADPDNKDIIYGRDDLITITFNRDTNLGWGPSGNLPLEKVVLKPDLDAVFEWSQNLGFNYTGIWHSRQVLVITILDATGATPPTINGLKVSVRQSGNLRNYPPSAAPSTSSAVLTGN